MNRCGWLKHDKQWVFMPYCMGGAARGPEHCTCAEADVRLDRLEEMMKQTMVRIHGLEHAIECYMPEGTSALADQFMDNMRRRAGTEWIKKAEATAKHFGANT